MDILGCVGAFKRRPLGHLSHEGRRGQAERAGWTHRCIFESMPNHSLAPLVGLLLASTAHAAAPQVFREYPLTGGLLDPADLFAIHIDNDGDEDLVGISRVDGRFLVLENLGSTVFEDRRDLLGLEPGATHGDGFDLDGDGREDLVVATASGELVLWRNEGPATPWTRSVLGTANFGDGTAFEAEDLNGDGVLDLVVRSAGEVGWLPSLGGGAIGPYIQISSVASRGIQLGDVDGNGVRDVIAVRSGPVTRWWQADGVGGFTPMTSAHGFSCGTFGDIDGDGVLDEIVLERFDVVGLGSYANYSAHWRLGLGAGALGPLVGDVPQHAFVCGLIGSLPFDEVFSAQPDRNGDGRAELLLDCSCAPGLNDYSEARSDGLFDWTSFSLLSERELRYADVNVDGEPDLLDPYGPSEAPEWLKSDGADGFEPAEPLVESAGLGARAAVADLDQDGWPDVVVAAQFGQSVASFEGLGGGQFGPTMSLGATSAPFDSSSRRRVADIDGDGDFDVAYLRSNGGIEWRSGDGNGSFGPPNTIPAPPGSLGLRGLDLGDVDGDGATDIVAADLALGLVFWAGVGDGTFEPSQSVAGDAWLYVDLVDLDADGDLDVVSYTANFAPSGMGLFEWANGGFVPLGGLLSMAVSDVAAFDLTGDGDQDLAWVGAGAAGTFEQLVPAVWFQGPAVPTAGNLIPESIAAGDMDGDGDDDLVVGYSDPDSGAGALGLVRWSPAGFDPVEVVPTGSIPLALKVADLDGDGDLDVVGTELEAVAWYENLLDPLRPIGEPTCTPAIANSTGLPGQLRARGTELLAKRDVTLLASQLPPGSAGFFLASQTQGDVFPVSQSQGRLCLGGAIGRYVGPGQILNAGAEGAFELFLDLAAMPTPTGPTLALPGSTWFFQAWYRDANPASTSNFTDSVAVTFE